MTVGTSIQVTWAEAISQLQHDIDLAFAEALAKAHSAMSGDKDGQLVTVAANAVANELKTLQEQRQTQDDVGGALFDSAERYRLWFVELAERVDRLEQQTQEQIADYVATNPELPEEFEAAYQ